ncbi:MAG: hypothetical protein OEM98_12790, partial [Gammaproteobacteria bacterium]|nr:hypothetical protein [Gammaproteobacteria bacterium]
LTVHAAMATSRALPSWNLDAVNGFAVDPSGDTLAAIRNRVIVLLSRAGNSVQQIPLQDGNVHSMQFLNRLHLQVRWDDRAVVYETRTGKAVAVLDRKLVASRGDGMLLATAEQHSGERWVQIWQVGGGDPLMQTRHDDTVCSVDFDADGSRILTASEDGTARIWTVPDGEEIVRVEHERPLTAAWFSPDGKTAVSAGNGRALWWETDSGQIIHRLVYRAEHRPYARLLGECEQDIRKLAVSFARPVPLLASATEQEEVDVYDFANKTAIQTVTHPMDEDPLANRGDALRIEFDADGSELRTANSNRERPVRTWDIATGQLINSAEAIVIPRMRWPLPLGPGDRYRADRVDDGLLIRDDEATATKLEHETHINDAAMSPDGRYVATTGADGTVNLFLFRTEDLIAAACRRVAADLTQKQWDQYVGVGEARRICVSRPGD